MFQMEIAKFMFKFNNQMLPSFFDSYFIKLDKVHNYNTKQKSRNEFYQSFIGSEIGKKSLHQHTNILGNLFRWKNAIALFTFQKVL